MFRSLIRRILRSTILGSLLLAPAVPASPTNDGQQDMGFGLGGRAVIDLTSQGANGAYAEAIAEAPSGVLYVGGGDAGIGRFLIARLSANGARDMGFGMNGLARDRPVGDLSSSYQLHDLKVQADGKPVALGSRYSGNYDIALCRYNVAGNLDASFDGDGCVIHALDLVPGGDEVGYALAILPDGRFLIAGSVETPTHNGGSRSALLMRLHADGSIDTGFGINGRRTLNVANGSTVAVRMALGADGSIHLHGNHQPAGNDLDTDRFVARYSAGGALIGAFGGNGIASLGFDDCAIGGQTSGRDFAADVLVDAQGRVYDCGLTRFDGPLLVAVSVARYLPTGALDPAFGTGGRIFRTFDDIGNVSYTGGCTLQQGRLVVALHAGNGGIGSAFSLGMMRFLEDGSTDPGFGAGGSMRYPIGLGGNGVGHEGNARVILQGDNLLMVGSASPAPGCCDGPYAFAVVRARNDALLRDGFE